MGLNINGTTGISGVDGSASAPALQGTDSNTGINFGSDTVNINTGGTTRATIDSSGKFGIGQSIPEGKLHIEVSSSGSSYTANAADTLILERNGGNVIDLRTPAANDSGLLFSDDTRGIGTLLYNHPDNSLRIGTNGSERIRIDSSGRGFFNRTSALTGNNAMFQVNGGISIDDGTRYRQIYQSGSGHLFFTNGTNQGYLSTSGAWTDASDINIKKDITDLSYGIDSLKNLKPRKFKMKSDDKEQIGFIAQEVESVIPEVVDTGNLPDGTEQKGLAYGHLTAVLTKALQEAVAKIEVLETKVAALEAG